MRLQGGIKRLSCSTTRSLFCDTYYQNRIIFLFIDFKQLLSSDFENFRQLETFLINLLVSKNLG